MVGNKAVGASTNVNVGITSDSSMIVSNTSVKGISTPIPIVLNPWYVGLPGLLPSGGMAWAESIFDGGERNQKFGVVLWKC